MLLFKKIKKLFIILRWVLKIQILKTVPLKNQLKKSIFRTPLKDII